jgi:7-keto-8-aminopelargonate synthetase-like enzyme
MRKEVEIEKLWHNTELVHCALRHAGVNIGATTTPITPIIIGDSRRCLSASKAAMDRSIYLTPMPFPVVPLGQSRLRATVTAEHCPDDLAEAARAMIEIWKEHAGQLASAEA